MTNLLGQLTRWRLVERLVRLAWGGARWAAVVGLVLAGACLTDWLADRYLGSESWHRFLAWTRVLAPDASPDAPPEPASDAVADETPLALRVAMTGGQLLLAGWLAYLLLVRPWVRTPAIDELAGTAEKAIPGFGHRLVTAVQLNRPAARTQGMSEALIAEVTREAGAMARDHNLLKLIDYRRLLLAAAVALPVLGAWGAFAARKPDLAGVLLRRQLLLSAVIPRSIRLENASKDVLPTGTEAEVRFRVSGAYDPDAVGRLRVKPDGQPEGFYDLRYAGEADGGAYFAAKLPPSTSDFAFRARLGDGRSGTGRIRFEAPPHAREIESWQLLPAFLGTRDGTPNGPRYERQNEGAKRGEVIDALPLSDVLVEASFTKPVSRAVLIPIERGDGVRERSLPPLKPMAIDDARTHANWRFPTTPRTIAYRIELVDDLGFENAVPIRRNVRMSDDRPPAVAFMPESTRHPDPTDYDGKPEAKAAHEWGDKLPLAEGGRVMVIYTARSDQGVGRANLRYRVYPKGVALDAYPEDVQKIQHPREDPENKVYAKLMLKPVTADLGVVGPFVPDLGLFQRSWQGLSKPERLRVNVEFYALPSPDRATVPPDLEAGGRYMFEIDGLEKTMPDGSKAKLELGDTVELFVEVFDKNPLPRRPPGYTREARRKIVVSGDEAAYALRMRDEQNKRLQDKVGELLKDQANVFKERQDEPKK
jgi:hypothetical protein